MLDELGLYPLPALSGLTSDPSLKNDISSYPLTLVTGDRELTYHHSRFPGEKWAAKVSPDPNLVMHPETAHNYKINEGDWVKVEVAGVAGKCQLRLKISDGTQFDVVGSGMG